MLKTPRLGPARPQQEKEYVAEKFAINVEEMNAIIPAQSKTRRDCPNNDRFLQFLCGKYRRFFSKQT